MFPDKGYAHQHDSYRLLFENSVMIVGHIYEASYSFNKLTGQEIGICSFYGDPTCALIGPKNDWCLVGGDELVIRNFISNTLYFTDLKNIHESRLLGDYTAKVLTDPWGEDSAIWHLTIDFEKATKPIGLRKIRDFKKYLGKPHTEDVIW